MSLALIVAVSCEPLTKVVGRALPFQFTTEPETKPVPLTVNVKSGPPGAVASGTRGWLTYGTGFVASASAGPTKSSELITRNAAIAIPQNTRRYRSGNTPFMWTSFKWSPGRRDVALI